jgi:CheY-like chemotaxis protein
MDRTAEEAYAQLRRARLAGGPSVSHVRRHARRALDSTPNPGTPRVPRQCKGMGVFMNRNGKNGNEGDSLISLLIIEDDIDMRDLTEMALSRRGFRVVACRNPAEAIEQLGQQRFDLIMTDLGFAQSSGWKLLRDIGNYSRAPVVVLTGDRDARDAVLRAGAQAFFSKPISMELLSVELRKLAEASKAS